MRNGQVIYRARNFAFDAHRDHKRKYTGEPYFNHLREVAGYCTEMRCRPEVIAAAWLHDVKEDQGVTDETLRHLFGAEVADLVEMLTDRPKAKGVSREVRKHVDRMHLANASPDGKTVKLADLISNSKDIVRNDKNFAVVYMNEKRLLLPFLREGHPKLFVRAKAILDDYFGEDVLMVKREDFLTAMRRGEQL